jgi:hypothetical protein
MIFVLVFLHPFSHELHTNEQHFPSVREFMAATKLTFPLCWCSQEFSFLRLMYNQLPSLYVNPTGHRHMTRPNE